MANLRCPTIAVGRHRRAPAWLEPEQRLGWQGPALDLGGGKRRSVGERRLHLRQTPPSRDRSAHPLLINAAGERRGGGPEAAEEAGPGLFGASVTYANERRN